VTTLTKRQRQVVELLAEGCSYAKIARTLGIKERTVRMHVEHIAAGLDGDGSPLRVVLKHSGRLLAA
jgi:DNA-binding CsgD family transcriptional regulator